MSEPLMMFGEFRFAIDTAAYNTMDRSRNWRISSGDVVGKDPIKQFIGPGNDEITLSGVIYPHHAGGLNQIEALAKAADTGEPRLLMTGYGSVLGEFYLASISENNSEFIRGGAPKKISFRASFVRKERD